MNASAEASESAETRQPTAVIPARDQGVDQKPTPSRARPSLATLGSVRRQMARIYWEMRRGLIKTEDGTRLIYALSSIAKLIEASDLQERLEALEARVSAPSPQLRRFS